MHENCVKLLVYFDVINSTPMKIVQNNCIYIRNYLLKIYHHPKCNEGITQSTYILPLTP